MEAIQEAIEQAVEERRAAREAGQLPEHIARQFMRDPLGMILSSQGVPMGISLKVEPQKLLKHRREQMQRCVRCCPPVCSVPPSDVMDQGDCWLLLPSVPQPIYTTVMCMCVVLIVWLLPACILLSAHVVQFVLCVLQQGQ